MKNIIKNGEGLVNERRSLKFWALMSIDILYTALTFSTFLCGEHSLWVLCSLEETQVEKGFQSSSVNLPECAQFVLYEALMEKGFLPDWFLMYTFLFQSPIPVVWSLHTGKHYFHCIILISGTNTSQIYLMMQDLVWFFFCLFQKAFHWRENVCDHNFWEMKNYFLNIICKIFILFIRKNACCLGH